MTASTDQYWMQLYQQQQALMDDALTPPREPFYDSIVMTTNPTPTTIPIETMILSPTNSYTNTSGQLTPKGGNVSKPIKRRSRASKRTPTTLLNANTTNFRELVQQFTGCPSSNLSSSSSSLGVHKGPITLNFQQGSNQIHHDTTTIMPQFSSTSYNQVHHHQVSKPLPWKKDQIQMPQQEKNGYNSFDYGKDNNFIANLGNSSRPSTSNMDVSNGLVVDNDFGLNDLTMNEFSNDTFM